MRSYCQLFIFLCIMLMSCKEEAIHDSIDYYEQLQTKLIRASPGETILLSEGFIALNRSLWVDGLSDVTIQGKGIDRTILSFKDQIEGSEGLKVVNSKNIILKAFTIEDSTGDLIKVENT